MMKEKKVIKRIFIILVTSFAALIVVVQSHGFDSEANLSEFESGAWLLKYGSSNEKEMCWAETKSIYRSKRIRGVSINMYIDFIKRSVFVRIEDGKFLSKFGHAKIGNNSYQMGFFGDGGGVLKSEEMMEIFSEGGFFKTIGVVSGQDGVVFSGAGFAEARNYATKACEISFQ
ncbi:MAG: hypothetical protein AAF292_17195 [Pseudomonadota bacterium]